MPRPGQLRQRVAIEQPATTQSVSGEHSVSWSTLDTVWAHVRPMRGRERFIAQQVKEELSHVVTVRYRDDVTSDMRLDYGGRKLYVDAIINPDERNHWVELHCSERR